MVARGRRQTMVKVKKNNEKRMSKTKTKENNVNDFLIHANSIYKATKQYFFVLLQFKT